MMFDRNEYGSIVNWLDRTAEKNPFLWLPCIILLAVIISVKSVADSVMRVLKKSCGVPVSEQVGYKSLW